MAITRSTTRQVAKVSTTLANGVKTVTATAKVVKTPSSRRVTKAAQIKPQPVPTGADEDIKPKPETTVTKVTTATKKTTTTSKASPAKKKASLPPPEPPKGPFKFMTGFDEALSAVRGVDPDIDQVLAKEHIFVDCFGHDPARENKTPKELTQLYYESLLRGVLAQQISGAAAKSIARKFKLLFRDGKVPTTPLDYEIPPKDSQELKDLDANLKFPTPDLVVATPHDVLRSAGLSVRKAEYVVGLSQAFTEGRLTYELFAHGTDDEIVDALVALKGIGPWSADMFLLFGLRRLNVFSIGDLGIQRGVSVYISNCEPIRKELAAVDWQEFAAAKEPGAVVRNVAKKASASSSSTSSGKAKWKVPDKNTMEFIASKFSPYRSIVMLAFWHLSAINMDVLEKK